jgi:hypothetical protein
VVEINPSVMVMVMITHLILVRAPKHAEEMTPEPATEAQNQM